MAVTPKSFRQRFFGVSFAAMAAVFASTASARAEGFADSVAGIWGGIAGVFGGGTGAVTSTIADAPRAAYNKDADAVQVIKDNTTAAAHGNQPKAVEQPAPQPTVTDSKGKPVKVIKPVSREDANGRAQDEMYRQKNKISMTSGAPSPEGPVDAPVIEEKYTFGRDVGGAVTYVGGGAGGAVLSAPIGFVKGMTFGLLDENYKDPVTGTFKAMKSGWEVGSHGTNSFPSFGFSNGEKDKPQAVAAKPATTKPISILPTSGPASAKAKAKAKPAASAAVKPTTAKPAAKPVVEAPSAATPAAIAPAPTTPAATAPVAPTPAPTTPAPTDAAPAATAPTAAAPMVIMPTPAPAPADTGITVTQGANGKPQIQAADDATAPATGETVLTIPGTPAEIPATAAPAAEQPATPPAPLAVVAGEPTQVPVTPAEAGDADDDQSVAVIASKVAPIGVGILLALGIAVWASRRAQKALKTAQAETVQVGDAPKETRVSVAPVVAPVAESPAKVAQISDEFAVNGEATTGRFAAMKDKALGFFGGLLAKKPDPAIAELMEEIRSLRQERAIWQAALDEQKLAYVELKQQVEQLISENQQLREENARLLSSTDTVATSKPAPAVATAEAPATEQPVAAAPAAAAPAVSMQDGISALATGTITEVKPEDGGIDIAAVIGEAVKKEFAAVEPVAAEPVAEVAAEPVAEVAAEPVAEATAQPTQVVTLADRADAARAAKRKPARGGAKSTGGKPAKVAGGASRPHHVVTRRSTGLVNTHG